MALQMVDTLRVAMLLEHGEAQETPNSRECKILWIQVEIPIAACRVINKVVRDYLLNLIQVVVRRI